jgi:hypothetical protein
MNSSFNLVEFGILGKEDEKKFVGFSWLDFSAEAARYSTDRIIMSRAGVIKCHEVTATDAYCLTAARK